MALGQVLRLFEYAVKRATHMFNNPLGAFENKIAGPQFACDDIATQNEHRMLLYSLFI